MSHLDDIEYELYAAIPPQNEDGSYKKITDKTRNQLKALIVELMSESSYYEYLPKHNSDKETLVIAYDDLFSKVEAL